MRNRDKNKVYWLLFSAIIIASLITPYIVQKAIILGSEGDDDEEESSFLMMLPPTPSNNSFPEDYFSHITKVDFIYGTNKSSNDLTDLKYIDGQKYELWSEYDLGENLWKYSIEFQFANLSQYSLIYYDLFLYFQVDVSDRPDTILFQAFSDNEWKNVIGISNQEIDINKLFLEKTTKFRLEGSYLAGSPKTISIERLCFLISHNQKSLENLTDPNGHRGWEVIDDWGIPSANYHLWGLYSEWYLDDPLAINHQAWGGGHTDITLYIEMEMHLVGGVESDIKYLEVASRLTSSYSPTRKYEIYNYQTSSYEQAISVGGKGLHIFRWENIDPDDHLFLDIDGKTKWRWSARVTDHTGLSGEILFHWIQYCQANISYDYPEITEIYIYPSSPLSTFEEFEIKADISEFNIDIDKAEYYIENWSSEWESMEYEGLGIWKNEEMLDASDFPNGIYTVWVNTTDDYGYSTLNYSTFEISNAFPRITFTEPDEEGKNIIQLYNYNINISVYDVEDNLYEDPQILIYKNNISEPILDWTTIERYNFLNPNYWNYTINPLDYKNGLYTIRIKTNDTRKIDIFNETTINIVNNPPSIEILEPSVQELISPLDQDIICNVTNEETINSVQWDVVTSLNGFVWKDLDYNITTEFYEGVFYLWNYEYGDTYYLVINATDDKYNSSIEIKSLQIHPLIAYYFNESHISYKNTGIIIYSNPTLTTDIVGNFDVDHNSKVKERDFEIYIPEKYNDAHKYYINRGFDRYEPVGFFTEGIYTLWHTPTYQTSDTVYFSLDKPIISNSLIEEEDDGTLKMVFVLRSKHAFSGITIQNQLSKFVSDPENYEYTLQFLYAGDWEDFDEDDYDVEAEDFPSFSFVWTTIGEGMEISFRFIAVPIEEEESAIGGGLLVGFVALALVELIAQIVLINRRRNRPEKWGWGKYILVSVGIGAGTFIAGFVAGLFLFG